jgi:hypothetical protein
MSAFAAARLATTTARLLGHPPAEDRDRVRRERNVY